MKLWTSVILVAQLAFIGASVADNKGSNDKKACVDSLDDNWVLVQHYANFDAPAYGDNSTTQLQCQQACLKLKGCTGYDWYPYGTSTHCWVGNNCPVSLTYDVNNQHYIPKKKAKKCYTNIEPVTFQLVKGYANFDAPAYGNNTTTHSQCRQACLDLPGCSGYDWYPYGTSTHCWVGNNCPVTLTADTENRHYVPTTKTSCYPPSTKYSKKDY